MRMPWYPWSIKPILTGEPTIGWLMDLCEENFLLIERLSPKIRSLQGKYLSSLEGSIDLYLDVMEQTPYTSLIHLTYYFVHENGQAPEPDPDALVRVYYDSRQIEVLELRQKVLPLKRGMQWPTLDQKWKANLFLSKWLGYCVQQGHHFGPQQKLDEQHSKLHCM